MGVNTSISTGSGTYTTGAANVPEVPVFSGNKSETIYITFGANENGDQVQYAIYVEEAGSNKGFVKTDGTIRAEADETADISADWQTLAAWGAVVAANGLTAISYRFKAKAKNEAGTETAFSAWSGYMAPYRTLDSGPTSTEVAYECTTGNTKISALTVSGSSNAITISYTLYCKLSRTSRVVVTYSKDGGETYPYTATRSGTSGDAITGLSTTPAGTAHTFVWATCTDLGNSYKGTVYVKITPYDSSPTGGYAGTAATSSVSIDNRPLQIEIDQIDVDDDSTTDVSWDRDTTPIIIGTMKDIVCGSYLMFTVQAKVNGVIVQENCSAYADAGWYYEQDFANHPGTWTAMDLYGVPAAYVPPTLTGNRVKYVFQSPLTQGLNYTFTLIQQEAESVV